MPYQKIVSVHFPKAGGTSLRTQLASYYGDALLLDYGHDPLNKYFDEVVSEIEDEYLVVHGHFKAARYDQVRNTFKLTFLRDPVDNILSIYKFWKTYPRSGNPLHSRFLDEQPDLIRFATHFPVSKLMSEVYFGGYDMSRFDFIGFHETRARDLPILGSLLGLVLDVNLHENKTNPADGEMADERVKAELRTILAADIRFYEKQRSIRSAN